MKAANRLANAEDEAKRLRDLLWFVARWIEAGEPKSPPSQIAEAIEQELTSLDFSRERDVVHFEGRSA